jgi:tetratricopeptide (TPR) repeat protein
MRALRSLLLAAALGATAAGLSGCSSFPTEANEKAKDDAARVETWMTSALTYYDGANYAQAERMFEKVLSVEPQNKKARRGLAGAKLMQGSDPALPEREAMRKLREAEALLLQVKDLDWTHATLGDRRFEVLSDLARVYSELADYYERAVHRIEHSLAHEESADAADLRAKLRDQIQARNELLQRAIPLYREVLARNPDNPYALAGLAKAHLQLGNDDLGIRFAERYLALSRQSQHGWRRQMESWEKGEKESGRAMTDAQRLEFISRIQGAREKEKKMHLLLGTVHMRREDFRKAAESYGAVIALDPSVPAAYVERAQAQAALGQYRLAIQDIDEYLKLTDPQRHREQRTNAVELKDRYERILERQAAMAQGEPGAPAPAGFPASR